MSKTYKVVEIFYSLQGEGVRAGTSNVFVRFSGCNMRCDIEPGPASPGGFACDTEFVSGRRVTIEELLKWIEDSVDITLGSQENHEVPTWIILTGGEPALQVDEELCCALHDAGYKLAIETNGTIDVRSRGWKCRTGVDWITCSPKVAEHAIKCMEADEVRYVRGYGQGIPKTVVKAEHFCISPAFDGDQVHPKTLAWCQKLCLEHPQWRLSIQTHKLLRVR